MIEEIRKYVFKGNFRLTDHAMEEMKEEGFRIQDLIDGIKNGRIIENYPKAYPLSACLINAKTKKACPIHICISLPPLVKIITVYKPSLDKWKPGFEERRKKAL